MKSVEVRWIFSDDEAPAATFDAWMELPVEDRRDLYVSFSPNRSLKLRGGSILEEKIRLSVSPWSYRGVSGRAEEWDKTEVDAGDEVLDDTAVEVHKMRRYRNGVELVWVRADGYEPVWSVSVRLDRPEALHELELIHIPGVLDAAHSMSYADWLSRR